MPSPAVLPAPIALHLASDDGLGSVRLRTAPGMLRLRHRVYVDVEQWAALQPWDKYLCRVHAYALVSRGTVFCLESAAVLLGLPVFAEPRDIHVLDPERSSSTRYGDVVVHTNRTGMPPVSIFGAHLATASAQTALDLGRVLPPAFGLAVADAMAHAAADPAAAVESFRTGASDEANRRGRGRLRWLSQRIDDRPESPGESVSRAVMEWLGYPAPELQHEFDHEGFADRSDFYWRKVRAIGESDGWGKYTGTADEVREKLRAEKSREDRLRRHERAFGRWDWADAMRATPLDRKLAAMGLVTENPRHAAALATLRHHPRSLTPRESDERLKISAAD